MIVGLLLAAGGATRFGSQKLVAPFRGEPLVRRAAGLLRSVTDETMAVVGNDAEAVRGALEGSGLVFVENVDWREGLASSLRAGIAAMPENAEAVVVALGDQPELDVGIVRALVETWRATGMAIVTARYRGVRAPPVLIAREMFGEVAELRGDYGAKALMDRVPGRVGYVEVDSEIPRDIDTQDDLHRTE